MEANYRTAGTKEFKKIAELRDMMQNDEPLKRKEAMILYNTIMKSTYDKEIETIESQIDEIEKKLRLTDKRLHNEKQKLLRKGVEVDTLDKKEKSKDDKYLEEELKRFQFKLKYYKGLKDAEIDAKLLKTKLNTKKGFFG